MSLMKKNVDFFVNSVEKEDCVGLPSADAYG